MLASKTKRLIGLAILLGASAPGAAFAQGYDPIKEALEVIGLTTKEKPVIDYRERAPLVVPPSTSKLRQPEQAAGSKNPNWPQDPDVLARRRKAEEGRVSGSPDSDNAVTQGGVVRSEVSGQRNRLAGVPNRTQSDVLDPNSNSVNLSDEQVQRILAANPQAPQLVPGVEPDRQYLTEPPKGYRKSAANAPYKATVEPMKIPSEQVEMNVLQKRY